jgi:dsDNA-binding SOS-regulon protein
MGARLLQNPDDENKITFTSLREADRYDPDRQGA